MDFLPVIIHSLNLAIKKIHHCSPSAIWEIRLLAEKYRAAIAQQHRKSMTSPHRGEQQAAPAEQGIIYFPFCQQSCLVHAVHKAAVTQTGHTHPPSPTPALSSTVRQQATQFQLYGQKGRSMESPSPPVPWESLQTQGLQAVR